MSQSQRRDFLKNVTALVAAIPAVQAVLSAANAAEEGGRRAKKDDAKKGEAATATMPMVKPGEGMAKGVNYVEDKKDIKDAALKAERQGVSFDKQSCRSCLLYTADGKQGGVEVGKCTLFQGQHVRADGWCTTWAKKP